MGSASFIIFILNDSGAARQGRLPERRPRRRQKDHHPSLLPGRSLKAELEQGRLVAVPLDAPGLFRPVGIIHRRRRKFSRAVAAFLELLEAGPAAAVSR